MVLKMSTIDNKIANSFRYNTSIQQDLDEAQQSLNPQQENHVNGFDSFHRSSHLSRLKFTFFIVINAEKLERRLYLTVQVTQSQYGVWQHTPVSTHLSQTAQKQTIWLVVNKNKLKGVF